MLNNERKQSEYIPVNLQHQLKIYLQYREMSAAQLSRKSGVSKQVISGWLGGSEPKKISQVKKIAEVLGTDMDTLCFGDGISTEEKKAVELDAILGDEWLSGVFEVKIRRIRRN